MSAVIIPFRAAPSELHRSSPCYPQPASGPETEIQSGHWRTRIRKFVSGHFFRKMQPRDRALGPGLPHHRHQYRWRFQMETDDWIAAGVIVLVCVPCLAYSLWSYLR